MTLSHVVAVATSEQWNQLFSLILCLEPETLLVLIKLGHTNFFLFVKFDILYSILIKKYILFKKVLYLIHSPL